MEDKDIEALIKGVKDEVSRLEGLMPKEDQKKKADEEGKPDESCPECSGILKYGVKFCPYCGLELEWN